MKTELDLSLIKGLISRYKMSLVPLVTALAAFIIIGLVIIPQLLGYLETNTELSDKKNKVNQLEAKAAALETLEPSVFQKELDTVQLLLPADPDIPQAMAYLQEAVSRSGLSMDGLTYLPSEDGSQSFQLSVGVSGALPQIRSFLISLSNYPRVFQVQTISISRKENEISASIPVSVYYGTIRPKSVSLESNVEPLSESEKQLLGTLSGLIPKSSGSTGRTSATDGNSSSTTLGRQDPFE